MSTEKKTMFDDLDDFKESFNNDEFFNDTSNLSGLVKIVRESQGLDRLNALMTAYHFSYTDENKIAMASPELGLIKLLVSVIMYDSGKSRFVALWITWNTIMYNISNAEICIQMINYGVHTAMLTLLRNAGPDRNTWDDITIDGHLPCCIPILMNMACFELAREVLQKAGTLDTMTEIMAIESNGGERVKAALTTALLIEKHETTSSKAYITLRRPEVIEQIVDVFATILDTVDGPDYPFGYFDLTPVLLALKKISIIDREHLAHKRILKLLSRVLVIFNVDGPEINNESGTNPSGGGGGDVDGAETAIEILLNLSCVHEDLQLLQTQFMTPETRIYNLMLQLSDNRRLGEEARANAATLQSRLRHCISSSTDVFAM